jgi:Cu-Zn family superoxide dismutase
MSALSTRAILTTSVAFAGIAMLAIGCKDNTAAPAQQNTVMKMDDAPATVTKAVAMIGPAKAAATQPANTDVTGTVTFTVDGDHLKFVADIEGLAPNTMHGFHIHEKGDLSDPELKSAGGHFNPTREKHGGPDTVHHHAGDLGNLSADGSGKAHLEGTVMHVSLGGENSILGRSVIIHAKTDDLKSQPAGDSGARIAGGIIKAE